MLPNVLNPWHCNLKNDNFHHLNRCVMVCHCDFKFKTFRRPMMLNTFSCANLWSIHLLGWCLKSLFSYYWVLILFYIFCMQVLCQTCFTNIFFKVLFSFSLQSLWRAQVFNSSAFQFIIVFLLNRVFDFYPRNLCLTHGDTYFLDIL